MSRYPQTSLGEYRYSKSIGSTWVAIFGTDTLLGTFWKTRYSTLLSTQKTKYRSNAVTPVLCFWNGLDLFWNVKKNSQNSKNCSLCYPRTVVPWSDFLTCDPVNLLTSESREITLENKIKQAVQTTRSTFTFVFQTLSTNERLSKIALWTTF